jgi:mono/diheme cytochrome c family protein
MSPLISPRRKAFAQVTLVAGLGFFLLASVARADDGRPAVTPLPAYKQECAACHTAFPPGALPAQSWQRLMSNLPQHFGTDASLDPATVKALSGWLTANAGTWKRVREVPPEDRITRSAWFVRKHHEIAPATWQRASIKSASNCMACHTRADQGDFEEDHVRIPR